MPKTPKKKKKVKATRMPRETLSGKQHPTSRPRKKSTGIKWVLEKLATKSPF